MRVERQDTPYSITELTEKEINIIYNALNSYPFKDLDSENDKNTLIEMCNKLRGILGIGWNEK